MTVSTIRRIDPLYIFRALRIYALLTYLNRFGSPLETKVSVMEEKENFRETLKKTENVGISGKDGNLTHSLTKKKKTPNTEGQK